MGSLILGCFIWCNYYRTRSTICEVFCLGEDKSDDFSMILIPPKFVNSLWIVCQWTWNGFQFCFVFSIWICFCSVFSSYLKDFSHLFCGQRTLCFAILDKWSRYDKWVCVCYEVLEIVWQKFCNLVCCKCIYIKTVPYLMF